MKKIVAIVASMLMVSSGIAQAQVLQAAHQTPQNVINPVPSNPQVPPAPSFVQQKPEPKMVTLPSGVKLKVVREGGGLEHPTGTSKVNVHYRGILPNGAEFDSSYKTGRPIELKLDQVIPCWHEAIPLMTPGAMIHLFCPSNTAYGERGASPMIPPNTNLVFQVELLNVVH